MSEKKSNSPTYVTSYRIGIDEKKLIVSKHGSLSAFLNKCVSDEIAKMGKTKKVKRYPEKKVTKKKVVKKKA